MGHSFLKRWQKNNSALLSIGIGFGHGARFVSVGQFCENDRMKKPLLPLWMNDRPQVSGHSEALQVYLAGVSDPQLQERFGVETITHRGEVIETSMGHLLVLHTQGEKFKGPSKERFVQGGRILFVLPTDPEGLGHGVVGGVNWTNVDGNPFVSNICVRTDARRQGLGKLLIEHAKRKFPRIRADANMTIQGALLMGYPEEARAAQAIHAAHVASQAQQKKPGPTTACP
jgi:GNAT superfamily N-acetyltransferase